MRVERLKALKEGKLKLMTHVIAGYPSLEANREMIRLMAEANVDVLEIQIPFSEPIADGPLFVKANQDAVGTGIELKEVLDFFAETVESFPGPVLMMGYYNTLLSLGEEAALTAFSQAGLSGFIVPDLPPEYAQPLFRQASGLDLAPIVLVAPNTDQQRMEELAAFSSGMVYAVARKGVTGRQTELGEDLSSYLQRCRSCFNTSIAVGFGLSSAEDVAFLKDKADVAIVGSALLRTYLDSGARGVESLLNELNQARQ